MTQTTKAQNKKIVFNDDGNIVAENQKQKQKSKNKKSRTEFENNVDEDKVAETGIKNENEEEDYFVKRERQKLLKQQNTFNQTDNDAEKKWYQVYTQFSTTTDDEVQELKENEQMELFTLCKNSFEAEQSAFAKRNPSDVRWLQTALKKGTAKDRANAAALLLTSNPLGNLETLTLLIGFSKISNKNSSDVITILTDLWIEVLLPPNRKLIPIQMRGADWKNLRKDSSNAALSKDQKRRIYAYWHFENELKDQYFEFLKNLQIGMQTGLEHNKNVAIVAASHLLSRAPEKEQMLLNMLINKLGDPSGRVASKALYHLTEISYKHPNMCNVLVVEVEKLLFRNNVSERSQQMGLCFLAGITATGHSDVCTRMINICFAFFKKLVQRGVVNNSSMQALLRCLNKTILEASPTDGKGGEVLTKEMQDTIYRLVHFANTRVAVQTLGLLLQLIGANAEKSDRFYNALYKKLLDPEVANCGKTTAAQFLHIVHRAIHIDKNLDRAMAFIKRLLQAALYMPPSMAVGCLVVIHKLLRTRRELENCIVTLPVETTENENVDEDVDDNLKMETIADSSSNTVEKAATDDDEDNKDLTTPTKFNSNVVPVDSKTSLYNPYHRVPAFAGAKFSLCSELLLLLNHHHPTVKVFADCILERKRSDYYGDPLRDFSLPHFLERYAFKNPKKLDNQKAELPTLAQKRYKSYGARGRSVTQLTKDSCTEDERFIFDFLERKRNRATAMKEKPTKKKAAPGEDDIDDDDIIRDDDLKPGEVDDDEFDEYLDNFFGKKAKAKADLEDEADIDDDDLDFLQELGGEVQAGKKQKQQKKKTKTADDDDEGMDDIDADWGDDDDVNEGMDDEIISKGNDDISDDDDDGSIELDDIDDDDDDDDDDDNSISNSLNEDDGSDNDDDAGDYLAGLNSEESDGDLSELSDEDEEEEALGNKASKTKKGKKSTGIMGGKTFSSQLKHSTDMRSLFAAADDFAELLEETGKTKAQGTSNAIYNKDKSSEKQLKWEEKRRSNNRNAAYTSKKRNRVGGGASGKNMAKRKKH